jgi:hypothetical protein
MNNGGSSYCDHILVSSAEAEMGAIIIVVHKPYNINTSATIIMVYYINYMYITTCTYMHAHVHAGIITPRARMRSKG